MKKININSVFDKNLMPEKGDHCVYSLINKEDDIIYVGQTSNLKQRIFTHLSSEKDFDFIEWTICNTKEEMNNLEAKGIVTSKGDHNKTLPRNNLYMLINGMNREIVEKIKEAIPLDIVIFTGTKGSKYITRENYDLIMNHIDESIAKIECDFKKARGE